MVPEHNEGSIVKTTTQPQPNLNPVGFDMIITLHTPHPTPPHRNSNSTRKKGARGLKFVMPTCPAILTTTQHNFNPSIFWGGVINPSSRDNPTNIFF